MFTPYYIYMNTTNPAQDEPQLDVDYAGRKLGRAITVGDVLTIGARKARVTALTEYAGPLVHLYERGARIAFFDVVHPGMILDNTAYYD